MRSDTYMILDELSPVEILYDDFAEKHGGPTSEILRLSKELRRKLSNLSDECATAIFDDVALLCAEYERTGFHGGFRYGMKTTIENWSK